MYKSLTPLFYSDIINAHQEYFDSGELYWFASNPHNIKGKGYVNISVSSENEAIRTILYGGRLNRTNIVPMIMENRWVNNTVYDKYDPYAIDLEFKSFYVMNSKYAVYKCIDNNNGAKSLIEPNFSQSKQFTLSDGYIWQYMYTLNSNIYTQLKFGDYMPIAGNFVTNVVPGTVSSIDVISGGYFYESNKGNILITVDPTTIRISDSSSNIQGIFQGYGLYNVTRGEIDEISEYNVTNSGKFVKLKNPHTNWLGGDVYEIAPLIRVIGNGTETPFLAARMNDIGNIARVDVITTGRDFTMAEAKAFGNPINMVSEPEFRVNLSPKLGHGQDIVADLLSDSYILHINMDAYNIANNFPINSVPINTIGVLSGLKTPINVGANPYDKATFDNSFQVLITPTNGSFNIGDKLRLIDSEAYLCEIIEVTNTYIRGIYYNNFVQLKTTDILVNDLGVSGMVVGVTHQPEVTLRDVKVLSILNVDTFQRELFSTEIISSLIKIRDK